eukprot:2564303-Prymnesium_polylepis.2
MTMWTTQLSVSRTRLGSHTTRDRGLQPDVHAAHADAEHEPVDRAECGGVDVPVHEQVARGGQDERHEHAGEGAHQRDD